MHPLDQPLQPYHQLLVEHLAHFVLTEPLGPTPHYEIWKYYQSNSRVHVEVLPKLAVPQQPRHQLYSCMLHFVFARVVSARAPVA